MQSVLLWLQGNWTEPDSQHFYPLRAVPQALPLIPPGGLRCIKSTRRDSRSARVLAAPKFVGAWKKLTHLIVQADIDAASFIARLCCLHRRGVRVKRREVLGALMPKRLMIWALVLILLLGAFPLLSLLPAVLFASVFGCQLDEGSVRPCVALGLDFGGRCIQWRSVAGSLCSQYRSPDWR